MQQHIFWRVETAFVPKIRHRCPRCEGGIFKSSGLFRLNANGSRIDVWLVYKCEGCEYTYNLSVYERVTPGELARRGVYEALLANDPGLAAEAARNRELLQRNGVRPVLDRAEYTVDGPLPGTEGGFLLTIELPQNLRLRTDVVLARKLGASRAGIQKRMKTGSIVLEDGSPCPKYLGRVTTLRFVGGK